MNLPHLREQLTMRSRAVALVIAATAVGLLATTGSATAGQGDTFCTWGGTPAAPTGVATFSPGVTNTPSTVPTYFVATGPLGGGAGCTGTLTFKGYAEPGNTCAVNAPFTVTASGFPPIRRAVGQAGVAGSAPVLLYDAHGNVVGSEQAQFLTSAANMSDPAYLSCNTPQGLTEAFWSDTIELFASK